MTKNTELLGLQGNPVDELPFAPHEEVLPLDAWLSHMYSNIERMTHDQEYRRLIAKRLS